jgi:antirestriction protein
MNHEQPSLGGAQPPQPIDQEAAGSPVEPQPSAPEQHEQAIPPPRIWVGSLADYTDGRLHGTWIEAAREPAEIQAAIRTVLASSPWTTRTGQPAEEWGIFDYANFGACRIKVHPDLSWVSAVAKGIQQHGPAFAAWADVAEEPERLADFNKAYQGHYDSLTAYVEQLINDLGYNQLLDRVVPPRIRPYVKINVTATAQDLRRDVHVLPATGGGVWIFNAR